MNRILLKKIQIFNKENATSAPVLVGIGVLVSSFILYLATLAPTLTWGFNRIGVDGGEFLAAAHSMGIPHPPGYPTYTLLLKLFSYVVPVGDLAFRGNLMSAVTGSLAVALIYWSAFRLCRYLKPDYSMFLPTTSAFLGSIVFATTPLFWSQAVMTEVYTLNTLFVASLLVLTFDLVLRENTKRVSVSLDKSDAIKIASFGFILGLGLGNHLTLLAIGLPLGLLICFNPKLRHHSPWGLAGLFIGLGIYLYLPIRSAQEPMLNWGNSDTLNGLLWMITGRVYQELVFGVPLHAMPTRILEWVELVFIQMNPLGLFLGLIGAAVLRTHHIGFFLVSSASIVALSIYTVTYATVDSEVLSIPAFALFGIWISIGFFWTVSSVSEISEELKTKTTAPVLKFLLSNTVVSLTFIGIAAMPIIGIILNYDSQDLSDDDTNKNGAYIYTQRVIESVPDGSILLSSEENHAFSLWYMTMAKEKDRNIAAIAVPLLQFDWYWKNISEWYPQRFQPNGPTDIPKALATIIEHNQGKSKIFFTYIDQSIEDVFVLESRADGLLMEARTTEEP